MPGGSPILVPMPGLFVAPKAEEDPAPKPALPPPPPPPPPPKSDVPELVPPAPKVEGLLLEPKRDGVPPNGVEDDDAFVPKPPPLPNAGAGAVVVDDPKRPPPLDEVAPNGLAPKAPPVLPNAPKRYDVSALHKNLANSISL